jgi:DNA polymerase I-like protein with 3'-5' exonuclease and polymerase domains
MREENWNSRLIGQIHDAIIVDVHPDELEYVARTIKRVTCQDLPQEWKWIVVPLDVDAELCPVDGSWAEKEDYKLAA